MEHETSRKRMKPSIQSEQDETRDASILEAARKEDTELAVVGSEEMELNITQIHEKIERFTEMISGLLESGKSMLKELSDEFEEQLITMHKEIIEKWQDEIKELRFSDASNEETNAILHNARCLLQNPLIES
ncbi:hypothetical protein ACFE04_017974 [Oxalis oulophora]